ncbi:unnamed protein product [Gongylonema pulchrum]|uniref:Uncharacterized protein n=1 Tax=Gongylonema pulchrum TaxID=637853 RepID=A0A3P7RC39_9BILA|nr:unnamed protein product [Gongylonema pulchrum]
MIQSADFFEDIEDLKSQLSPDGSLTYCWQHSQKEHLVKKLCLRLQCIYKKSRIHGAFPILILAAYSFFGGFIFYLIEYPHEQLLLEEKKAYFEREKRSMHRLLLSIELVLRQIRANHSTNRYLLNKTIRIYQRFALNRIDKAVYWYVLNMYHLSDQETYRASVLQPVFAESRWLPYFSTNFGQMRALQNYTEQVSLPDLHKTLYL